MHCLILLKFDRFVHYRPDLEKTKTTGMTGDVKWQCIANCLLFQLLLLLLLLLL